MQQVTGKERRPGVRPRLDEVGPHWQRDQRSAPAVWVSVWDALRTIPGVIIGPSASREPDARAVLVPNVTHPVEGTSFSQAGAPLEPAHLHGPLDTSLHVVLPPERAAEVVALGWAIPCPYARFGTELILFALGRQRSMRKARSSSVRIAVTSASAAVTGPSPGCTP